MALIQRTCAGKIPGLGECPQKILKCRRRGVPKFLICVLDVGVSEGLKFGIFKDEQSKLACDGLPARIWDEVGEVRSWQSKDQQKEHRKDDLLTWAAPALSP